MEDLDQAPRETSVLDLAKGPLPNAVKALERGSVQLPTDQDFHFYSNFQQFKEPVGKLQSRVVSLLSQLGSLKAVRSRASTFPAELDEDYDWLVGVQDDFLERVDASLDRFYLERKDQYKQKPELNALEALSKQKLSSKASHPVATQEIKTGGVKVAKRKDKAPLRSDIPFHIPSIPRPQDKFDEAVDNSNTPFKHHAPELRNREDLQASTSQETAQYSGDSSTVSNASVSEQHARTLGLKGSPQSTHPLEEELMKMAYVEDLLDTVESTKYKSLDDTPFTLVTTLKDLKEMAAKLQIAGEIAVDLENHHYRSYQGFICLMQVSTRDEDFIVDTLDLRSQIGPCLGGIFSNPTIRKVMHGADHDIVWLQRDFGIYVCNLFDTGQAARVLQLQGFGLGFLLEHFCGVHADKRYQLADWRIRPLPLEMIKYAREDTHYLLYTHDMLMQELLKAQADGKVNEDDPFFQVYKRSRDICLQLYAKEIFTETSYQQLYGLQEKKFRPDQLGVLAGLYAWRDQISRQEDESPGYVLRNHVLFQLASEMPDNIHQLQSFVKGSNSLVARNASAIIGIILQAKEKALRDYGDPKEDEQMGVSLRKAELPGDKLEGEVSKIHQSEHIKSSRKMATKSPQSSGEKILMTTFSNILQGDNLGKENKASSTLVRTSFGDNCASDTTESEKADVLRQVAAGAVPEVSIGVGQLKLTSEIQTGPVVVSRRTSSSFFNSKPRKTPSLPLPSSHVSTPMDVVKISEIQHPCTAVLAGQSVPIGDSLHSADPAKPEAFASEHGQIKPFNEGQWSDQAKERTASEKFLEMEPAATSMENRSVMFLPKDGDIHTSSDMPFTVPEITPVQVSLKQPGNDTEIHAGTTLVSKSTIQAPVESEDVTENAPVVQTTRKPSQLGALLGGRSRVHQVGAGQSSKDLEQQVQARTKTQEIESSMVLPFGPSIQVLLDTTRTDAQHPTTGEAKVVTSIPGEMMENHINELKEENGLCCNEQTLDRPVCSTAQPWQDVLMLDLDADEACPSGESEMITSHRSLIGKDLEEPRKHQVWWPSAAEIPSVVHGRDSSSSLPGPADSALDQFLDEPHNDMDSHLPPSLSEMYHISKRGKKSKTRNEFSHPLVNTEVLAADLQSQGHVDRTKKRRREPSLLTDNVTEVKKVVSADNRVGFRSFNYREARNSLGLQNFYADKAEDRQGMTSRGRGQKKDVKKLGIPSSKSAFDPLRRARQDPRPDGIPSGQRRQVFPQTGNRTAVFKQ